MLPVVPSFQFGTLNVYETFGRSTKPEVFSGGLLGVSAKVTLHRDSDYALVSLSGIPIGGAVSGRARFGRGGDEESVVVEEPLKGVLARRFVKLIEAKQDETTNRVLVTMQLPMGLGKHTIELVPTCE